MTGKRNLPDMEEKEALRRKTIRECSQSGQEEHKPKKMTGKEKIAEMLESGEFAEAMEQQEVCPGDFGMKNRPKSCRTVTTVECSACWRKALESEVGMS